MKQKTAFVIMRAQPFHKGHAALIEAARQIEGVSLVCVMVGSANRPRSVRNPWTYAERSAAIMEAFQTEGTAVMTVPVNDHKYSDVQWRAEVRVIMDAIEPEGQRVLVGHNKPGNDYLAWFPDVEFLDVPAVAGVGESSEGCATDIRNNWMEHYPERIPAEVMEDMFFFRKEAKLFRDYPFKETLNFNCADSIVECDGHIALIRRGGSPGKGQWAMPGGFKNADETFLDCAIRELREEVNIRVPEKVLRGSVVATRFFDAIDRGNGIPRNTMAVHIRVARDPDGGLPRISPADDAMHCEWVPIYDAVNNMAMFDDHQDIVCAMLATAPVPAIFNKRYR